VPDEREQGVGLGRAGHELHLPVEEHDTGPVPDVRRGPVQQDGLAERVRDVRAEAPDEVGLARGEAELAILAVQAQVPQQWPPMTSAARSSSPSPTGRMMSR
jgi:hypothetical protein